MPALVELLASLVAIDSTSTRSNAPIITALEGHATRLGLQCTRQSYRDSSGTEKHNLIARFGSGAPELALVGHSDCVPFDPTWAEALTLTERNGMLYGRGSCDTKAFIACALTAAELALPRITKPFALIFTADEELGCIGAKRLLEAGSIRPKRAIIGEPTSLRPIRANKGYCLAEVEVRGKEGHSAYPDTGANAIFGATRLMAGLEAYSLAALRAARRDDFVPPFTTLNVGLVSGGKAKNIIAGACRFTLEWRPLPRQRPELVLEELQRLAAELEASDSRLQVDINAGRLDQGFDTDPAADVVQFLAEHSGKPADTVAFGTEGPQLSALGATPVVFGPGDITVAHQTGEHVPTAELLRAAEVLEAAVVRFCA